MTGREATSETAGAARAAARGTVEITVNGEVRAVVPGTTVTALLADMDVAPRGIAVAVDGEVVPRRLWDGRALSRGEHVDVLSIAQGG